MGRFDGFYFSSIKYRVKSLLLRVLSVSERRAVYEDNTTQVAGEIAR